MDYVSLTTDNAVRQPDMDEDCSVMQYHKMPKSRSKDQEDYSYRCCTKRLQMSTHHRNNT